MFHELLLQDSVDVVTPLDVRALQQGSWASRTSWLTAGHVDTLVTSPNPGPRRQTVMEEPVQTLMPYRRCI